MRRSRHGDRWKRKEQRAKLSITLSLVMMLACGLACHRQESPQASLEKGRSALRRGDLSEAEQIATQGYHRFLSSNPGWAARFRILEAESLLLRGSYPEVLDRLNSLPPLNDGSSQVQFLVIRAAAMARLHQFAQAAEILTRAGEHCRAYTENTCGEVSRAWGVLALQQGHPDRARVYFLQTVAFARDHGDRFLEATASLNLGLAALADRHFDEAIDWTGKAYQKALDLNAGTIANKALGNLGWAYYNLGDSDNSLDLSLEAEKQAGRDHHTIDQLSWLTNAGYVYQQAHDLAKARELYLKALSLARSTEGTSDIFNSLRALALVCVQQGDIDRARAYADEAVSIARADKNRNEELYPLLVRGFLAFQAGAYADAETIFHEVDTDLASDVLLRWQAEHALARLYEIQNRATAAEQEYRHALATFETARSSINGNEAKMPFLTNGVGIYDDYIHFLVAQNRPEDALRWADLSRARTLAEGLGNLPTANGKQSALLRPQQIARAVRGTLLFYWLGEGQSFLWTIGPQKTALTVLPPSRQIESVAMRYWKTLSGPQSGSPLADRDGQWLYRTLIAPVQASLPKDSHVFIIPDGSLNNLNFEALIATDPAPHFWIDDVTVANASSLRMLSTTYLSQSKRKNLLLIGNSIAPNDKYPELPRAAAQMESVASHFSTDQTKVFSREQATPVAYLGSHPEKFSYIHFVAHGVASRTSPLDSAIILSSDRNPESFKLYARDIIANQKGHPLQAELVTISACYGTGVRTYTGEGLVGLSWAFLRAGARNVVGALWEASDSPTEQLMSTLYAEIQKGRSASTALRDAKLHLLHNTEYANPFYWAPFQLHTQGHQSFTQ